MAIGNSPFSPGGIGTTQLVFTIGFAGFAGKGDLFALSLAVSAFNLLVRIPMGLVMGKPLAEEAVEVKRELSTEARDSRASLGYGARSGRADRLPPAMLRSLTR